MRGDWGTKHVSSAAGHALSTSEGGWTAAVKRRIQDCTAQGETARDEEETRMPRAQEIQHFLWKSFTPSCTDQRKSRISFGNHSGHHADPSRPKGIPANHLETIHAIIHGPKETKHFLWKLIRTCCKRSRTSSPKVGPRCPERFWINSLLKCYDSAIFLE